MGPLAASLILAQISSLLVSLANLTVKSTTETSGVGTRKAIPVSLPLSSGITLPTALAAPVEEGIIFWAAPRPPRQSLPEGPSTVFLGSSRSVNGGHQTLQNSEVVIDDFANRSQAIGGAASITDHFHVGGIRVFVDAHDKHGCISRGCGNDDFLAPPCK